MLSYMGPCQRSLQDQWLSLLAPGAFLKWTEYSPNTALDHSHLDEAFQSTTTSVPFSRILLSESSWNSAKLLQFWLPSPHRPSYVLPHAFLCCWAPRVFSPSLALSTIEAMPLSTLWFSMLLDFPQTLWECPLLLLHQVQSSDINFVRYFKKNVFNYRLAVIDIMKHIV